MYEKFFQFERAPFNLTPDPHFFFFSRHHEEAFSQIIYGIQERKGFILITGEVGTGKTTLCRMLLDQLGPEIKTALIFNPNMTPIELLQAVNQDFGIKGEDTSKKALLDELNQYLLEVLARGENAVVIVDEAQNLDVECLEEVRLLSNLETSNEKLIQIVLVGQPELRQKLMLPQLRQLNQRIALRYHLEPLDLEMAQEYIRYRLKMAGGADKVHFTPAAVEVIHQFSRGIPRLINILCDKALLAAYVSETTVITPSVVKEALKELGPMTIPRSKTLGFPWPRRLWVPVSVVSIPLIGLLFWWGGIPQTLLPQQGPEGKSVPLEITPSSHLEVTPMPAETVAPYAYDSQGIFRVKDPEESERAAYLTLLRLWQTASQPRVDGPGPRSDGGEPVITPQEFKELDPDQILKSWGLYQYPLPLEYQKILILGYPGLVWMLTERGAGLQVAVLADASQDELTLLDPLIGRVQVSPEEFQRRFTGKGILVWREIPGLSLPLAEGAVNASVQTLQTLLKMWGFYPGPVDGILGSLTQRAIRSFQQEWGLEPTGQVGMETYLVLARAVMRDQIPTLRDKI